MSMSILRSSAFSGPLPPPEIFFNTGDTENWGIEEDTEVVLEHRGHGEGGNATKASGFDRIVLRMRYDI